MQTRFAASKLTRYLHHTLTAVDHHLHCLAFVLLRIHRVLSLFCFHRVLFLSLSSRVRQIGGGSLYAFIEAPNLLDQAQLEKYLARLGPRATSHEQVIVLLLWYAFLGILREDGTTTYIHDVNY